MITRYYPFIQPPLLAQYHVVRTNSQSTGSTQVSTETKFMGNPTALFQPVEVQIYVALIWRGLLAASLESQKTSVPGSSPWSQRTRRVSWSPSPVAVSAPRTRRRLLTGR